jgi:dipeptidyl aminopeptidase/acylaminoacyl peptidase
VKARDGETDIYGMIVFPSHFDPSKKYPVIDSIYPGPQIIRTPKSFPPKKDAVRGWRNYWFAQVLVELGFIVITIDGLGTPLRSKMFHDYCYGNMEDGGGLADHIAAFKQLQTTRPYLDLDRVGIFGYSGGGFASTRAMFLYPDFYKVAVSGAGNHDQRGYNQSWGEHYQGSVEGENYVPQANMSIAKNLKGKLLLIHGDMDDNVHPALTIQVVDALIKANKDFDLLILPNLNHVTAIFDPYYIRKQIDYFVMHLLGKLPPKEYKIKDPDPTLIQKIFASFYKR